MIIAILVLIVIVAVISIMACRYNGRLKKLFTKPVVTEVEEPLEVAFVSTPSVAAYEGDGNAGSRLSIAGSSVRIGNSVDVPQVFVRTPSPLPMAQRSIDAIHSSPLALPQSTGDGQREGRQSEVSQSLDDDHHRLPIAASSNTMTSRVSSILQSLLVRRLSTHSVNSAHQPMAHSFQSPRSSGSFDVQSARDSMDVVIVHPNRKGVISLPPLDLPYGSPLVSNQLENIATVTVGTPPSYGQHHLDDAPRSSHSNL